jgi:long-chain acyl-CoA synthetase
MFMLAEPELRYILTDSKAKGVVTDTMNVDKVRNAVHGLDHVEWIAVLEGEANPGAPIPEHRLEDFFEGRPETSLPSVDDDDVALMLYTSGTTGRPNGVMLSHTNLYASAEAANDASELDSVDSPRILMSAMPMAHIFGVGVMNSGYLVPERLVGGYSVQMAWFEPERFMALIQQHHCNSMAAVPTMLILILNHPKVDAYDLSSLEEVVCGAAPLPVEIARTFTERYGCHMREIYGLTESTGTGAASPRSLPYKPGSTGKAYFNVELQIFDTEDRPLPPGEKGEIVIRGPVVMKGYYNKPEETAKALRSGWLHSGDVGYLDEEGYLFISDRVKDMIIKGGENIYPAELEDILFTLPGVAEVAVVGTPHSLYGETVVAFIVPSPEADLSEEAIIDFVKTRTSSFKAPSKVHFVEALPKTPVGKVLKRELRKQAARLARVDP